MSIFSTHYEHWEGKHRGIWYRRAVIAFNGLSGCLQGKWLKRVIFICWTICFALIAILFLIGRLLDPEGLFVSWISTFSSGVSLLFRVIILWLTDHPEISVPIIYNFLFFYFINFFYFWSMFAISIAIPNFITQDLSSRAIIVYSSKAIGKFDYIIGKFGTVLLLLTLTWLGPVFVGWFAGTLLTSEPSFFWHSREPILKSLEYVCLSMMILGLFALGVSAISSKGRSTVAAWMGIWLGGYFFSFLANVIRFKSRGEHGHWLENLSLEYNLEQIKIWIFNLKESLEIANEKIPVLGKFMNDTLNSKDIFGRQFENPDLKGVLITLGIMGLISILVLLKRVKPE